MAASADRLACSSKRAHDRLFGEGPRRKLFFPVLHVDGERHPPAYTAAQARLAMDHGADGVVLCSWPADVGEMVRALGAVREELPKAVVGANFLCSASDLDGVDLNGLCDFVWTDSGVNGRGPERGLHEDRAVLASSGFGGLLFGSFAFKGRSHVPLERMPDLAADALALMDVQTTSGSGTGVAMAPERAAAVRAALGPDAVVTIASGVTVANVAPLLPSADIFFVGTGVEAFRDAPLLGAGPDGQAAHERFADAVRFAAGGDLAAAVRPDEDTVRGLVRMELDLRLATVESISRQSEAAGVEAVSSGALSVWTGGGMSFDAARLRWLWQRAADRAAATRDALAASDAASHHEAVLASVGASGAVVQGRLDPSRVAALAAAVHAHDA